MKINYEYSLTIITPKNITTIDELPIKKKEYDVLLKEHKSLFNNRDKFKTTKIDLGIREKNKQLDYGNDYEFTSTLIIDNTKTILKKYRFTMGGTNNEM